MKHNVLEKKQKLNLAIDNKIAGELFDDFKREMLRQFKKRKSVLEDWQNLTPVKLAKMKNRVGVIADKETWTEDDLKDLALISALLWNHNSN
jgi:hypothetical protein